MPTLPPAAIAALQRGDLIEAIKLTREATGLGLKESKNAVERYGNGGGSAADDDDAFDDAFDGFDAPPAHRPSAGLPPRAMAALQRGRTIEAIKLTREATGLGLKEAKDLVDAARGQPGGAVPGLASEGATFDPMHEPGRVRGGGAGRWVALAVVLACLLVLAWMLLRG